MATPIYYQAIYPMSHISILLYDNALSSSIALPWEMFTAANQVAKAQRNQNKPLNIELAHTSPDSKCFAGLSIHTDSHFIDIKDTDLIILPALWRRPNLVSKQNPELLHWLKHQHNKQTKICAVGSAANILAEAGLLDGRAATTHWQDFERFSRIYPQVKLQRHHLITEADNVYCAGSVNSLADLSAHFIKQFYGASIANTVEQNFSPEIRQPFETQRFSNPLDSAAHDESMVRAQAFIKEHYMGHITIVDLASELDLSVRTLNRRFKQASGISPAQYLQLTRITAAAELIKKTNLSLSEIAETVGYSDYSHFAKLFKRHHSTSPQTLRRAVRSKLFLDQ